MTGARVVVTGAAGFFGLAMVRALTRDGVRVLATDRVDESGFKLRPGTVGELVSYLRRDLERESLDDLVDGAAGLVHAAALTPADETAGDTAERLLSMNLQAFLSLLGAVRRSPTCRRVLFVSSAGAYDQSTAATLREEDADGGTSLYGAAKLAAEVVGRRHAALFGREFAALRPTSLIGPGEVERPSRPRVTQFAQLMVAALERRSVRLERPQARSDWLAVDDAAEAVALLWRAPSLGGRAFNVSSGHPRPLTELADAVVRVAGLRVVEDGEVVVAGGPDRAATISNERLVELGWRPRRSLEDVVRAVLAEQAPATAEGA